ncbi:MAG: alpha/beta hydrolase [Chloroflexi bacterium]|nr:alpha/beta hydrolase [Chloroflexota bacterium]
MLDALEVERAVIVGNSQGGQIAVDTAIEFPKRVAGVVNIGANIGGYEPDITPEETALFEEMDRGIWEPARIEGQPMPLEPRAAERGSELADPGLAIAAMLHGSEVWMTAQYLAANAPDARAVLLPNVAHMIAMETPEEIARLVAGFVAALPMPLVGR